MTNTDRISRLFNGTHTIESTRTGDHRTVRVSRQKADAKFAPGQRIAELLVGPDNENDFQGFAFVTDEGELRVWKKKAGKITTAIAAILADLTSSEPESTEWFRRGYWLHTSGMCFRCNRKLTTPESIETGIGPVCRKKIGG